MYFIEQPDKATVYQPDASLVDVRFIKIFLAGSIEMGKAEKWHDSVAEAIASKDLGYNYVFHNPRRDEDFTPKMEISQIVWEQDRMEYANYIFMYLDPTTKSPISLLEFGEFISSGKLYVAVDPSFYRYNNLVLTAEHVDQANKIFDTKELAIKALQEDIKNSTFD